MCLIITGSLIKIILCNESKIMVLPISCEALNKQMLKSFKTFNISRTG